MFAGVGDAPGFVPVPRVFVLAEVATVVGDAPGDAATLGDGLTATVEAAVGNGEILRVTPGVGVLVGCGVWVTTGVGVFVTVGDGVLVTVGDGVLVTVGDGVLVSVGDGVLVTVGDGVLVSVGVTSSGACAV